MIKRFIVDAKDEDPEGELMSYSDFVHVIKQVKSILSSLAYAAPENYPLHLSRLDELVKEHEEKK